MAIQQNNNGQQQQRQQARQGVGGIGGDLFSTLRGIGNGLVAQGVGGEYFSKMKETLGKTAEDLLRGVNMTIIPLSRQEYDNLRFSAMLVAFQLDALDNTVAYHTLILEATGEELRAETRNIDNQQVRINLVTSDANDVQLAELANRLMTENFSSCAIYPVAATVVPRTIDASSEDQVTPILRNAAVAATAALQSVAGMITPVSLEAVGTDTILQLDMVTDSNGCKFDAVGNPQRAAVNVTVSARQKGGENRDPLVVNAASASMKICEVSGFVNPIWAPQDIGQNGFGYIQPQQQIPTGKLVAEYVITGVHTPFAQSGAAVALALSTVLLVTDNNNWVQALIPKSYSDQNDLTDVGALNVICNVGNETENGGWGSVVNTDKMSEDLTKFNNLIGKLFRPGCVVSIDCPESAPQSWYLNQYAAAAMGDADAIASVIDAFNELTGGRFSTVFPAGGKLFSNVTRVPLGYYIGADKKMHDIRDVDLTAICNAFKNNPDNIHVFNDTFVPRLGSGVVTNLAKREGIIGHVLKEQFQINGYAMRCTFSGETIQALSKALNSMSVATVINTPLNVDSLRNGTPAPDFISSSLANTSASYVGNVGSFQRQGMNYSPNQFRR